MSTNTPAFDAIKRKYGQNTANYIRSNGQQILELEPDKALDLLKYCNKYKDIQMPGVINFLVEKVTLSEEKHYDASKNWKELLDEAGYDAYIADTHEKHNKIRRYYSANEMMCYLNHTDRTESHYIINAVKKNVASIRRASNPEKHDEYGTSVISIHINKIDGHVLITNRYNHTIDNPDNTFFSNPDNIIPGLTRALEKEFNINLKIQGHMPEGFVVAGNYLVRELKELNGYSYSPDYHAVAENGELVPGLDPGSQLMFDTYVLDLKECKILDFDKDPKHKCQTLL